MSRINMKQGITTEQVNEANAAYDELQSMFDKGVDGRVDLNIVDQAIAKMNEAADALSAVLGDDHMATRRVSDASIRAQVALEKLQQKGEDFDKKVEKLRAKVRSYDGWFVMVEGEKIPVTVAVVKDGRVIHGGEEHPFIPVYMPGEASANAGLRSLFDQD